MDRERLTALCASHRMKSKLTLYEWPADDAGDTGMAGGWDVLVVYDGAAGEFSVPAWIDLREAVIAEMRAQGYELVHWYALSDDRQHGMGWVRRGMRRWDSDPRAWHPGFRLRRERLAEGLCVACGGDLRGTTGRCPKCGAIQAG